MLKAARVQGSPTMVIAIRTAATTQATAIQRPPNTIHRTLSRKLVTGMVHYIRRFDRARIARCMIGFWRSILERSHAQGIRQCSAADPDHRFVAAARVVVRGA